MAKKAAVAMDGATDEKAAKVQALHYRRMAMATLGPTHGTGIYDKKDDQISGDTVLKKLFREIGPRFKDRPGGYTRIVKQHYRRLGDAGETAIIEILKAGEQKHRLKERKPAAPAPAPVAPAPTVAAGETPAT
jgi:large subunit ribosomal protein L17